MTGLKLLADRVEGRLLSRATAGHAASIGVSGALSFACADLIASVGGWRAAFIVASVMPPSRRCSSAARCRVAADLGA